MGGGRRVEVCERPSGAEAGSQNRVEPKIGRRKMMPNPFVIELESREGGAYLKARRRRGLSELPTDEVGSWREAFHATAGIPSGVP